MKEETVSVTLDCNVLDDLKEEAQRECRDIQNQIKYIIKKYLQEKGINKPRPLEHTDRV